jgi:tRNA-dependent cyclodipeptide synthase
MNAYKVTICKSPGWRNRDVCTLGVSVPSSNWQGERFASILNFAAAHFRKIRIDVTDEPYRHNFMAEGMLPGDDSFRAHRLGTSWLVRHQALINACPVTAQVIRWGNWYKHPDYGTVLEQFRRISHDSALLAEAIKSDVEEFYRRLTRAPTNAEREHSRNFLIEELTVITLQARGVSGIRIYPGDQLHSMQVVSRGLIPGAPLGNEQEQFAEINLRSRSSIEAANDMSHSPNLSQPRTSHRTSALINPLCYEQLPKSCK